MTITLDATTSTATPRAAGPRRSLRQLLKSKIYALQDRVMDYALHSGIIYNVAWEDPRVDGELLRLGPEDNLLVLTTGGCNVLDRLIDGPAHIVAVDLNPCQNALLELKLACLKALTHEQVFQLFAQSNRAVFDAVYRPSVRPLLSEAAAAFWDRNASFFDGAMYAGASGFLARALLVLVFLFGLRPFVRALPGCADLDAQRTLCDAYRWRLGALAWLFQLLLPAICPFAGVPAAQMTLAAGGEPAIPAIFRRVFRGTHIAHDNYFYHGYLYGTYTRTNCPRYLRPEHFDALKAAAGRVTVRTALLTDVAAEYDDGYFGAMILLDHMDWLTPTQVVDEWRVLSRKLHPTRGRVLWRSFAHSLHPPALRPLERDAAAVAAAERRHPDRVAMYNSTFLAKLPPGGLVISESGAIAAAEPVASKTLTATSSSSSASSSPSFDTSAKSNGKLNAYETPRSSTASLQELEFARNGSPARPPHAAAAASAVAAAARVVAASASDGSLIRFAV